MNDPDDLTSDQIDEICALQSAREEKMHAFYDGLVMGASVGLVAGIMAGLLISMYINGG